MAQVFTTPVRAKADRAGAGHRLWDFFVSANWGVTVLQQQDGSFVERIYVDQIEADAAKRVYLGGHVHKVTAAEVAALTAAGYGGRISTVADDPVTPAPVSTEYPAPTGSPNPPNTYP